MGMLGRNPNARKRGVTLSLSADLVARAKEAGLDPSRIAEEALARALEANTVARVKLEVAQDLAAYEAYVAEHGSPAELARKHFDKRRDAI